MDFEQENIKYKRQLELSAEVSGLVFWEFDFKTNAFTFNDYYYKFLKTTIKTEGSYVMGVENYFDSFIPQSSQKIVIDVIGAAFEKSSDYSSSFEYEMRRRDGEILKVLVDYYISYDEDNKPDKSYGTKYNLTQRIEYEESLKQAKEKAEKANKVKSEFLASMSHEIRTPLNAINGFIDIISDEYNDEKLLSYISIIDKNSDTLLEIIDDILDFNKIESGKLDINKEFFQLKDNIKYIVDLFSARASQKNINLILNLSQEVPDLLKSDSLRLKQILSNLLSNAIKFTDTGGIIELNINASKIDKKIYFSVKDTGIGINKQYLTNIFNPFSQEHKTITQQFGGTGLGLSISHKLVDMLGGELKVKSKKGVGSEFYFDLPYLCTNDQEVQIIKDEENRKLSTIDLNGKHILLVEDNHSNQIFMQIVLKKMGLTFDIANDGVEAIEVFKNNKYDVILMDENMPNMNGIEAAKKILEIEKEQNLKHTPIIALTANALKGDKDKFLSAGMDEYLTKPVDRVKLSETIYNCLYNANSHN